MIMQGNTQRRLTWLGSLLVLALGVTLLPMVPTWAQAPATGTSGASPRPEPQAKPRDNIEKQEQHLRALAEQLEHKRAELDRLAKDLHQAKEKLAEAKKAATGNKTLTERLPAQAAKGGQDLEQRLRQLEQKVDMILQHVQALRKDQTPRPGQRSGTGAPPKTKAGPGAAAPLPAVPVTPPALPGATAPPAVPRTPVTPPPAPPKAVPPPAGPEGQS